MSRADFSVTVRDESFPRSSAAECLLQLRSPTISARDLVAERVRQECDCRLVSTAGHGMTPLVERMPREVRLNRDLPSNTLLRADPEVQIERALAAFGANAFLMLVDDRQVTDLTEEITITDTTVVTFLTLTPLQGG